jgi:hypothetical protein
VTNIAHIEFCPCLRAQPPAVRMFARKVAQRMPKGSFIDAHINDNCGIDVLTRLPDGRTRGTRAGTMSPNDVAHILKGYLK